MDIIHAIVLRPFLGFDNSEINLALRLEYTDRNVGSIEETGGDICDKITAIVPGISFRPKASAVFRISYRYMKQTDILGNLPAKIGGVQFGFAGYFLPLHPGCTHHILYPESDFYHRFLAAIFRFLDSDL